MSNKLMKISEYAVNLVKADKNVYILVVDGWECYCFNEAKKMLNEEEKSRIINTGISEQNTVGVASGLSKAGKKVYVFMFAAFLSARAFDQVKLDIGYDNANVILVGIHGGFLGPRVAGYSHFAVEDLAMMNAVSNLTIFNPANIEDEVDNIMEYVSQHNGPVYIRLDTPSQSFFPVHYPVTIGKLGKILDTKHPDIAIVATGNMVSCGMDLANKLMDKGFHALLYSAHTIKPFDKEGLVSIIKKNIPIITMEEHVAYGGLASIVAEQIAINKSKAGFFPVCIKDKKYNLVLVDYDYTLNYLLDVENLFDKVTLLIHPLPKIKNFLFSIKTYYKNKQNYCIKYSLCGITLLKKKYYTIDQKPKESIYLLGIKLPK